MKNVRWLLPLLGLALLAAPRLAGACPTETKCECNCNAGCMYGETCKFVKECKVYKSCRNIKVCSYGKDVCCSGSKAKVCHIPPGNPFNAHTICVGQPAVQAHLDHGDYLGKCHPGCEHRDVCKSQKCCTYTKKCECNEYNSQCPPCNCPSQDAGFLPDMEQIEPDMKQVEPDMKQVEPDMKQVEPDMKQVEPDAGRSLVPDMKVKSPDAGPKPDLEVIEVDAECPTCPNGTAEEPDLELIGGGGCSVGSFKDGAPGFAILALAFLALGLIRRSKAMIVFSVLFFTISAFGSVAYAAPPVNNFKTAPGFSDYYTTMNPKPLGHLDFNAQLVLNYAHKPLRIVDRATGNTVDTVLRFRMNVDFAMAIGLFDWFELGVVVPTSAGQGAGNLEPIRTELNEHDFQLPDFKDLRVVPKIRLLSVSLSEATFLRLGLAMPITAPTGDRDRLLGENGPTITPTLLAGLDNKYFSMGLNVGVLTRYGQYYEFRNQTIASANDFIYGFGLNVPLAKDFGPMRRLDFVGDLWGSVEFAEQDKEEIGLEAMGGFRTHMKHGVVMNAAAGGGITKGYGVPEYRVMWGFGWEFDWQKPKACPTCVCKDCKPVVKIVEKLVPVIKEKVLIIPPVYFDTDKHSLRQDAIETLDRTVDLLKQNPWVKKVRLEGHCDFRASNKYNEALGWRRVYAVRNYLIDHGIAMKKLEARGYGETQPVNNSKVEPGLQKNRRVEFHILEVE
jgi:outer membrane protein OmpA-like peptidoglycan-associated protein